MKRSGWNQFVTLLSLAVVLPSLTACGGGLDLKPVTGVVTLDGQPVSEAAVLLAPVAGGPVASAATDAQGRFTMNTTNDTGALAGEYRVAIVKQIMHNVAEGVAGPGGARVEWLVPERYSRVETSGLSATVPPQDGELTFALVSP